MKKVYILFMAGLLAFGAVSCSKDDNSSSSSNTGGNTNPNPSIDVWAKSVGTYKGTVTTGQGTTPNMTVTVTKLSDSKIRITPGAENTMMSVTDVDVFKSDTSLYQQQGTLDGTLNIVASSTPPKIVFTLNSGNIGYFGEKQ